MKVLVTGATGFLGREIVKELLANDFDVLGISQTNSAEINCVQIDITIESEVEKLKNIDDIDAIIHCAGLAHQFEKTLREDFFRVNVKGTENIVNLANLLKVKHFILISSVSVYGKARSTFNTLNFQEEAKCSPIGDYAKSKFDAEKVVENISSEITLTILRPATIIGENDRGNVNRLIQSIENKRFIQIGKCENYKTLVDKNYVAKICLEVLEQRIAGIFNVANNPIQMIDILNIIYSKLNKHKLNFYIPRTLAMFLAKTADFVLRKNYKETIDKWVEDDIFVQNKLEITLTNIKQINVNQALSKQVKLYLKKK